MRIECRMPEGRNYEKLKRRIQRTWFQSDNPIATGHRPMTADGVPDDDYHYLTFESDRLEDIILAARIIAGRGGSFLESTPEGVSWVFHRDGFRNDHRFTLWYYE